MIKMEAKTFIKMGQNESEVNSLGNQNCIDGAPVKFVDEGERCHPAVCRVNAGITNDGFAPILQHAT